MPGIVWAALAIYKDPAKRSQGTLLFEAEGPHETTRTTSSPLVNGSQTSDNEEHRLGAQPTSDPTKRRQALWQLSRVLHAAKGRKLLPDLKPQADAPEKQRALVRAAWAHGQGSTASATCQRVEPWERTNPDLFRKILARNLGSRDRDMAFGTLAPIERNPPRVPHANDAGVSNPTRRRIRNPPRGRHWSQAGMSSDGCGRGPRCFVP